MSQIYFQPTDWLHDWPPNTYYHLEMGPIWLWFRLWWLPVWLCQENPSTKVCQERNSITQIWFSYFSLLQLWLGRLLEHLQQGNSTYTSNKFVGNAYLHSAGKFCNWNWLYWDEIFMNWIFPQICFNTLVLNVELLIREDQDPVSTVLTTGSIITDLDLTATSTTLLRNNPGAGQWNWSDLRKEGFLYYYLRNRFAKQNKTKQYNAGWTFNL